jgi:hypothetical protein
VKIWDQDVCERGLANAAVELDAAQENWLTRKAEADLILKIAGYRYSRARKVYSEFRRLLYEFVEVSEEEYPEIEEAEVNEPVSAVEPELTFSREKSAWFEMQRRRVIAESESVAVKRVLSFQAGCFSSEHPMFSK